VVEEEEEQRYRGMMRVHGCTHAVRLSTADWVLSQCEDWQVYALIPLLHFLRDLERELYFGTSITVERAPDDIEGED
jgi:hypothetical protein